jgi:hypothetical protein
VGEFLHFGKFFWVKIAALCLLVKFCSKQKLHIKNQKKRRSKRKQSDFQGFQLLEVRGKKVENC